MIVGKLMFGTTRQSTHLESDGVIDRCFFDQETGINEFTIHGDLDGLSIGCLSKERTAKFK